MGRGVQRLLYPFVCMLITARVHLDGTDVASIDGGQIFLDRVYKAEGDYIALLEYVYLEGYHICNLKSVCSFKWRNVE